MNKEDVKKLGWAVTNRIISKDHVNFRYGNFIMAILFDYDPGFHDVLIKDAEGVHVNIWKNSDFCFHGMIKTPHDLERVMMFCGIIEYKDEEK